MFTTSTDVLRSVLDKHTPLKTKIIKKNQVPFTLFHVDKKNTYSISRSYHKVYV